MPNKISAVLSDEDKASALTSIGETRELLSFLIALSNENRKKIRRMGSKSVEYVNLNLQATKSFAKFIPNSVNLDEFAKDVALINQLIPIRMEVAALLEGIEDTLVAAGSDAMGISDIVYSYLKTAGRNDAAVKTATTEIAKRYKRRAAGGTNLAV